MSIISPFPQNSNIKIYRGIPWGDDYKDIRKFSSPSQRDTFLASKEAGEWNNCSVVKGGERIKLTGQYNDYITCNYMSFTTAFPTVTSERTYYCFIKSVDYVNINTFEITYVIDWIQTFLFEFEIGECFVEREHVNDDSFGIHTVPEDVDTGEMIIWNQYNWTYGKGTMIQYIAGDKIESTEVDGIYGGAKAQAFPATADGRAALNAILENFNDSPERVLNIVMIPLSMVDTSHNAPAKFSQPVTIPRPGLTFSFGGKIYTAKNNKLACYPYTMITVDNYGNQIEQYHFEDFTLTGSGASFTVEGQPIPKPAMMCYPTSYKGKVTSEENAVFYDNFPLCSWINDSYQQWLAERGNALFVSTGASLAVNSVSTAANIAGGNYLGAIGGIGGITGQIAGLQQEVNYHKLHSNQIQGTNGNGGLNFVKGNVGFRGIVFMIKPEAAERIDKYFTRYGYRVDEAKKPNITGRQYFNYVKCAIVEVSGNVSVDAHDAMANALLNGVTFWHTNNMTNEYDSNPIV